MKIAYRLIVDELVEGCRENNRLAQRRLYEYFYGRMMGVCLRYAGNREEALEILNTGFYKVFRHIRDFSTGKGALESWVRRIMINTAIDHYRKQYREERTTSLDQAFSKGSEPTVLSSFEAEELMKLIRNLSPAYRTVFNLYAIEGYSHKEIAEMLNISEGTSKSNLSKARARLQQELAAKNIYKKENYAGEI